MCLGGMHLHCAEVSCLLRSNGSWRVRTAARVMQTITHILQSHVRWPWSVDESVDSYPEKFVIHWNVFLLLLLLMMWDLYIPTFRHLVFLSSVILTCLVLIQMYVLQMMCLRNSKWECRREMTFSLPRQFMEAWACTNPGLSLSLSLSLGFLSPARVYSN